jgi:hypothetical protein
MTHIPHLMTITVSHEFEYAGVRLGVSYFDWSHIERVIYAEMVAQCGKKMGVLRT